jgi:hypothetical protein
MTAPALTTTRTFGADRRATATDMAAFVQLLKDQKAQTLDLVVPASAITMEDGVLQVAQPDITTGDFDAPRIYPAGTYRYSVSDVADDGFSTRLDIPREFLRRKRHGGTAGKKTLPVNMPLYDALVNLSLAPQGSKAKYLLRLLTGDVLDTDGQKLADGYIRAFLTNGYRAIDNFDVLVATLEGIRAAGINPASLQMVGELTERRMHVRIQAPEVSVMARDLLENYRSPYRDTETGRYLTGAECPEIYAGLTLTNSETGHGSYGLTPQSIIRICRNGQTWTSDVRREVHLGERLEEGAVRWSANTQNKHLELIRAKAADAVRHFLSVEYLQQKVDGMREKAGITIEEEATEAAVEVVAKECTFTEKEAASVLKDFGFGGDYTVGGMVQAVTSAAQRTDDPDRQLAMESATEKVYALANVLHNL